MSGVSFKINQFNSTDRCFLTEMPAEILFNIHSHLETKDTVSLSNTCNYLFNQREIKSKNSYELFEIKKFITNLITKLDKITEVKINIEQVNN